MLAAVITEKGKTTGRIKFDRSLYNRALLLGI